MRYIHEEGCAKANYRQLFFTRMMIMSFGVPKAEKGKLLTKDKQLWED